MRSNAPAVERLGCVLLGAFLRESLSTGLPARASDKRLQVVRVDPDRFRNPEVPDLPALDQRVDRGRTDREALGHLAHRQEPDHGAQLWSAGGPARGARNDKGRIR